MVLGEVLLVELNLTSGIQCRLFWSIGGNLCNRRKRFGAPEIHGVMQHSDVSDFAANDLEPYQKSELLDASKHK